MSEGMSVPQPEGETQATPLNAELAQPTAPELSAAEAAATGAPLQESAGVQPPQVAPEVSTPAPPEAPVAPTAEQQFQTQEVAKAQIEAVLSLMNEREARKNEQVLQLTTAVNELGLALRDIAEQLPNPRGPVNTIDTALESVQKLLRAMQ